jgi:4-amino-4-deoxy-L-arabinose transferase-like glycosyltransferase
MKPTIGNQESEQIRKLTSRVLLSILLLALIARALAAAFLPDQGLPDAGSYRTAAEEFRSFQLMKNPNIMPLYPLLVAAVGSGWGQKLADLVLSLLSVWLTYAIALRIYRDEAIALIAAVFCALWPHFIFFAAVGLTETLFIALVLAAFLSLYERRFGLASVFLVLSVLTRPAIDLLAPVLIALFSLCIHREPLRVAAKRILTYVVVCVALMAPWWAYNYARYGEFVRLDLGGGMVLYTGNNPQNSFGGGVSAGQTKDVNLGPIGKIEDPVRRDKAFREAALRNIQADPWRLIAMMPVKFARLWRPWPFANEYHSSLIVLISVVSAVPTFAFAMLGFATTVRANFVRLLPCLAYIGYLTLVHVVTFGSVRYRVPMEPFVLILAAAGLVDLLRRLEAGRQLLAPLYPLKDL